MPTQSQFLTNQQHPRFVCLCLVTVVRQANREEVGSTPEEANTCPASSAWLVVMASSSMMAAATTTTTTAVAFLSGMNDRGEVTAVGAQSGKFRVLFLSRSLSSCRGAWWNGSCC